MTTFNSTQRKSIHRIKAHLMELADDIQTPQRAKLILDHYLEEQPSLIDLKPRMAALMIIDPEYAKGMLG